MPVDYEPIAEAHAAELFAALGDEQLYAFIPDRPPASEEALRERYRRLARGHSPDGRQRWLNWVIRDDGVAVGTLQATVDGRTAHVAYVVFTAHQGRGHATRALRWLLDWLTQAGVDRARATVDARNAPSIALLERAGFSLEHTGPSEDTPGATDHRYARSLI